MIDRHFTRKAVLAAVLFSLVAVVPVTGLSAAGPADIAAQEGGNETAGNGTAAGPESTITVTATGEVQAQPDTAVLSLAVVASGDSPENATGQEVENASRLRSALADATPIDPGSPTVSATVEVTYRAPNGTES